MEYGHDLSLLNFVERKIVVTSSDKEFGRELPHHRAHSGWSATRTAPIDVPDEIAENRNNQPDLEIEEAEIPEQADAAMERRP